MANTNGPGKFFKNRKKKKQEKVKKEYLEDVREYLKKNPSRPNPFPPSPFEKKELGGTIGDAPMKKDKMMTGGSLRRNYTRGRGK